MGGARRPADVLRRAQPARRPTRRTCSPLESPAARGDHSASMAGHAWTAAAGAKTGEYPLCKAIGVDKRPGDWTKAQHRGVSLA
jgi:hypothetical protein